MSIFKQWWVSVGRQKPFLVASASVESTDIIWKRKQVYVTKRNPVLLGFIFKKKNL